MNIDRRSVVLTLAVVAALGAVGAAAVVGFGLYDVSARAGHLPGVNWVLHTTYRRSVALRAGAEREVPPLDDADLVALGARHFDGACRGCHEAPGYERSATIRAMVPEPPHVTRAVGSWSPAELHWIVHEGVKMSGMPAWPSSRDDDVWAVVAFLREIDGMTRAEYEALVARPVDTSGPVAYCVTCHGARGDPLNSRIPRLDILSRDYMVLSLAAYRSGARESGIMEHAASAVAEADLVALAEHFAAISPSGAAGSFGELEMQGLRIARDGGSDDVPACIACHGPWPEPLDARFPSLAGQPVPYLATQLRLWRDARRGGTPAAELMHHAARELDDAQIAALAAYYAALAPARLDAVSDP